MYIYQIFSWILLNIVFIFRNFYGNSANNSRTKSPIHITPLLEAFKSDGAEYVSDSDNFGTNNTTVVKNESKIVILENPSSTTDEEVDVNHKQPKKRQKQNVKWEVPSDHVRNNETLRLIPEI